jgi:hypothetical protein
MSRKTPDYLKNIPYEVAIVTRKSTGEQWKLLDLDAYYRFAEANDIIQNDRVAADWEVRSPKTGSGVLRLPRPARDFIELARS